MTWRLPRFSALLMDLRASARTDMRTMVATGHAARGGRKRGKQERHLQQRERDEDQTAAAADQEHRSDKWLIPPNSRPVHLWPSDQAILSPGWTVINAVIVTFLPHQWDVKVMAVDACLLVKAAVQPSFCTEICCVPHPGPTIKHHSHVSSYVPYLFSNSIIITFS